MGNTRRSLGNKIREYRKRNKMTQAELAEMLGVSRVAVNQWENNKTFPQFKSLEMMDCLELDTVLEKLTELEKILKSVNSLLDELTQRLNPVEVEPPHLSEDTINSMAKTIDKAIHDTFLAKWS